MLYTSWAASWTYSFPHPDSSFRLSHNPHLGIDPIWFGFHYDYDGGRPHHSPGGINVFVMRGIAPDVPMGTIFRGIIPFLWGIRRDCHPHPLSLDRRMAAVPDEIDEGQRGLIDSSGKALR